MEKRGDLQEIIIIVLRRSLKRCSPREKLIFSGDFLEKIAENLHLIFSLSPENLTENLRRIYSCTEFGG